LTGVDATLLGVAVGQNLETSGGAWAVVMLIRNQFPLLRNRNTHSVAS
jgi:hypothetical protein